MPVLPGERPEVLAVKEQNVEGEQEGRCRGSGPTDGGEASAPRTSGQRGEVGAGGVVDDNELAVEDDVDVRPGAPSVSNAGH